MRIEEEKKDISIIKEEEEALDSQREARKPEWYRSNDLGMSTDNTHTLS